MYNRVLFRFYICLQFAVHHQLFVCLSIIVLDRDSIGDNSVLGDLRWGGAYGVDLDFTACDNCRQVNIIGMNSTSR